MGGAELVGEGKAVGWHSVLATRVRWRMAAASATEGGRGPGSARVWAKRPRAGPASVENKRKIRQAALT
jgi:hypothetical protein